MYSLMDLDVAQLSTLHINASLYLSAGSNGFCPSFSTFALFFSAGSFGSILVASLPSSCCPIPDSDGLLTGVCTESLLPAVAESFEREKFVACP